MPGTAGKLLTTVQVCQVLKMNPRQVQRLTADGYLEVRRIDRNRHGTVRFFGAEEVESVRRELPHILKRWDQEDGAARGAAAAWRRLADWRTCQRTRESRERFLEALQGLPERSASLLRASFFLYHLNHYAKAGESSLYELKERVLAAFAARFTPEDGLRIYFIPGPPRLRLCPDCRLKARSENKSYREYARSTGGCPSCRRDEGYYSLYEFLVTYAEHRFCFHSPLQIARKWLKGKELPEKDGTEREGGYPFGRPISAGEAAAVNLAEVVAELKKFLKEWGLPARGGSRFCKDFI